MPDGPSPGKSTVLDDLRKRLVAAGKKAGGSAAKAAGNEIVRVSETSRTDFQDRAALIKQMKHFYMVAKKGNQSIWVVDQPASYGEWDFEHQCRQLGLFLRRCAGRGAQVSGQGSPVVTVLNRRAAFTIAAVAIASCLLVDVPTLASESLAEPALKKEHPMESAKRRAPVAKPVVAKGIRYEQMRRAREHGYAQSGGVIAAVEEKTDKVLWSIQLYTTTFDPAEELDAQEVYVKDLALAKSGHALLATDERRRVWSVDLVTHAVMPVSGH